MPVASAVALIAIAAAVAGSVLALMGKRRYAPILIAGAFVLGGILQPIFYAAFAPEWYFDPPLGIGTSLSWTLSPTLFLDTVGYYGLFDSVAQVLLPWVGMMALLAASVLSLISYFRQTDTDTAPSTAPTTHTSNGEIAMTGSASGQVPGGWYPDPDGKPAERYWNGSSWGEETRPRTGLSQPPMVANTAVSTQGRNNGMGTAALVMGILGLFLFPIVFSILAIIFGSVGIGMMIESLGIKSKAEHKTHCLGKRPKNKHLF